MKGQVAIGTLVVFIALVITAALAAGVLVAATQNAQSKAEAVYGKTLEKATYAFKFRGVEGLTTADDSNIEYAIFYIELAPGSGEIDLEDVTTIWRAANGAEYDEYDFNTTSVDLNTAALSSSNPFTATLAAGKFYVVGNRTSANEATPDRYVESGELYAIAIKLPATLDEGEDWQITVRAPYIQDTSVDGIAPEVLQSGRIEKLA